MNFKHFRRIRIVLATGILFFLCYPARGGEFLIFDQEISWGTDAEHGFNFIPKKLSDWPSDWTYPDDYYNGQIYTRYEVIDVATSLTFGMQFSIYQYKPDIDEIDEICEDPRWLDGVGSISENHSSPASWWSKFGAVDFSHPEAFTSLCAIIWCSDPFRLLVLPMQAAMTMVSPGAND